MNPQDFFSAYEEANSSSDTSAIGDLYAGVFLFAGTSGVQPVTRENFLKVIPRMKAHFVSMGLMDTRLQSVDVEPITSQYLLVNVVWKMRIRVASGVKDRDAPTTYILMRQQDDALSIVFQIDHQDLGSLIKDASVDIA